MRISNILERPIVTEKSYAMASKGVYGFKVTMTASKESISQEIKKLYGVDVVTVNINIMPGKPRRMLGKRTVKTRRNWKKAIIKLKEGQTIDIMPKE